MDISRLAVLTIAALLMSAVMTPAAAQQIDVRMAADDRIRVMADNATLTEVAAEVELQTGVPIIVSSDSDQRVSIDLQDATIDQVAAALSSNYLVQRRSKEPDSPVVEILLLTDDGAPETDSGTADNSEFLPSGEPVDVPESEAQTGEAQAGEAQAGEVQEDEVQEVEVPADAQPDQFTDEPDVPNSEPGGVRA